MDNCSNESRSSDNEQLSLLDSQLTNQTQLLFSFYRVSEVPILSIGTIGHLLSLMTMFSSRSMKTPSFLYHKALTFAELAYCVNALFQHLVDTLYKVENQVQTYDTYGAAVYSSAISRAVSSITGYIILYMTLLIANERFIAVILNTRYRQINTRKFALSGIAVSCVLATLLNSWSSPIENTIRTRGQTINRSNEMVRVMNYRTVPRQTPELYLTLRDIKNVYNSVIRIGYPVLLALLTVAVIAGFSIQAKRRKAMTQNQRKASKRETSLFSLLLLIVFLAFLQVIPTELKRIFDIVYPDPYLQNQIDSCLVSLAYRLYCLSFSFYGMIWTRVLANMATFINRSFNFYLYIAFNGTFRNEFLKTLHLRRPNNQYPHTRISSQMN